MAYTQLIVHRCGLYYRCRTCVSVCLSVCLSVGLSVCLCWTHGRAVQQFKNG